MSVIRVQKVPKKTIDPEEKIARFCYYFPQYTFAEAKKLPDVRINRMLKVVDKEKAQDFYLLTQIIAAPHAKSGNGVQKMLNLFKNIAEGKNG
jgi:hypothetical protein